MASLRPSLYIHRITALTPAALGSMGIRGLVLDVDNTLTTHDCPTPFPDIAHWLTEVKAAGIPMVILSNNSPERVEPFAEILGLPFIASGAKPSRKGFREAAARFHLTPREIGVVGDQLFTDIWGGNRFGATTILVEPLGPETVAFIKFKRKLERLLLHGRKPQELPAIRRGGERL